MQQSDTTSQQLFQQLSSGGRRHRRVGAQNQINQAGVSANGQLNKAKGLDVPDEMRPAQQNFLLTMQMRKDGIYDIAGNIQAALGKATPQDALNSIAPTWRGSTPPTWSTRGTPRRRSSRALHGAGIGVGGTDGVQIEAGQFLPDLQWLTPAFIAGKLGACRRRPPPPARSPRSSTATRSTR